MSISTRGMLWSDMGGRISVRLTLDGVLVQTRSRVLSSRVGKSMICSSPASLMMLPNFPWRRGC